MDMKPEKERKHTRYMMLAAFILAVFFGPNVPQFDTTAVSILTILRLPESFSGEISVILWVMFILAAVTATALVFRFIIWRNREPTEETMDRFWRTVSGAVAGGCLVGIVLDFSDPSVAIGFYLVVGSFAFFMSMIKPEPPTRSFPPSKDALRDAANEFDVAWREAKDKEA